MSMNTGKPVNTEGSDERNGLFVERDNGIRSLRRNWRAHKIRSVFSDRIRSVLSLVIDHPAGKYVPAFILAAGLAATHQLWRYSHEEARSALEMEFEAQLSDAVNKITSRIDVYEQVLIWVEWLVSRRDGTDSQWFSDFVSHFSLLEKYPGMRSIRFQSVSKDSIRSFSYDTLTLGNRAPVSSGQPILDTMLDSAFDRLNQTRVSPPIRVASTSAFRPLSGFSLVRSVMDVSYSEAAQTGTVSKLLGWVVADIQMTDFIGSAVDSSRLPFAFSIRDGLGSDPSWTLYDSGQSRHGSQFHAVRVIYVKGRAWTIVADSLPAFDAKLDTERDRISLVAGSLVTFLLAMLAMAIITAWREMRANLQNSEESNRMLESALSQLSAFNEAINQNAVVSATDPEGKITYVNDRFCEISGYSREELMGRDHGIMLKESLGTKAFEEMWGTIKAGHTWHGEICNWTKSGERYWLDSSVVPMKSESGEIVGYLAIRIDVTKRKRVEEELRRDERLLNTMFEKANAGICLVDVDGKFLRVNPRMEELTGYVEAELLSTDVTSVAHEEDSALSVDFIERAKIGALSDIVFEKRYRRKDGKISYAQVSYSAIRDEGGQVIYFVAYVQDIAELKEREFVASYKASHDTLTGLPNRALLLDRLDMALARSTRLGTVGVVMFIDLDGFKLVNDTYGHDSGDHLLLQVASRLKCAVRDSDTVARVGGDEFVIILDGVASKEDGMSVGNKVLQELRSDFTICDVKLNIGASIGMSIFPSDGTDPMELQRLADEAMYRVKKTGKNRCEYYE